MVPIPQIIWHEYTSSVRPARVTEPEAMEDLEQVRSYVKAYEWGGPTSALQLHHLRELATRIRPGDTIVDLCCGPGPLLLELAALYPQSRFIGADLSRFMLDFLLAGARERGLTNVSVLQEDVSVLPSLANQQVDLVITTSALHHLPDAPKLRQVFQRMRSLIKPDGGFYIFDFGLLRSERTRQLLVKELSRTAPPLTVHDYDMSLRAAFPIAEVVAMARDELPKPFSALSSSFVDFFYFLQTPSRAAADPAMTAYIEKTWKSLSPSIKIEHLMLRTMRRSI